LIAVLGCTHYFCCVVSLINQNMFSVERSYRRVVDNMITLLVLKFDSHTPDRLGVVLFTSPTPESVEFLNRFQKLQWLLKLILK
jgi:glutamate racemase